jgi:hypothetical protein
MMAVMSFMADACWAVMLPMIGSVYPALQVTHRGVFRDMAMQRAAQKKGARKDPQDNAFLNAPARW